MHFYAFQVDAALRIEDSSHQRWLSTALHLLLPYILLLFETHWRIKWPMTLNLLSLPTATSIVRKPRSPWHASFLKSCLNRSLVNLSLLRNMLRLTIKRRWAFPCSPSETEWLRMLQYNTLKRVKRIPLRENWPALDFTLGYVKLAVSCWTF